MFCRFRAVKVAEELSLDRDSWPPGERKLPVRGDGVRCKPRAGLGRDSVIYLPVIVEALLGCESTSDCESRPGGYEAPERRSQDVCCPDKVKNNAPPPFSRLPNSVVFGSCRSNDHDQEPMGGFRFWMSGEDSPYQ
jgi:hypothetical protein